MAKMLQGHGATELGIAGTAVVTELIKRLVSRGTLKHEEALALLGDAADGLEKEAGQGHKKAAKIIRKEIVPAI